MGDDSGFPSGPRPITEALSSCGQKEREIREQRKGQRDVRFLSLNERKVTDMTGKGKEMGSP